MAAACSSGSDGDSGQPDATPTQSPPPADATAIRQVDLTAAPETLDALQRLGSGDIVTEEIIYADLTSDRREEAIVPVTSGGTLGNIAYLVFTMDDGEPSLILTRTLDRSTPSGLVMDVGEGVLVETVGEYGPSDPFCCPSVLRKTYFQWSGSSLDVDHEEREQRPPGPKDQ